jgi:RimJ/RimL family protein N-acetyltransferase
VYNEIDMLTFRKIKIDDEITLVPYKPNYKVTLPWYQDLQLVKQVSNSKEPFSLKRVKTMYSALKHEGWLYYIRYQNLLVGDVTLFKDGHISITICNEYQNKHIGRRVIQGIIKLAQKKEMKILYAEIYPFNTQSKKMFTSLGFSKILKDEYIYQVPDVPKKRKSRGEKNENS